MNKDFHNSISINEQASYINILHRVSNTNWVVSNTAAVRDMLNKKGLYFECDTKTKRPKVDIYCRDGTRAKKNFAPMGYACYRQNMSNDTSIKEFATRKNGNNTIDHLDEDVYNNTVYNLAPMLRTNNLSKKGIPQKFKHIFSLTQAFDNGVYRAELLYTKSKVRMFSELETKLYAVRYYCDNEDDYIALLKYLRDNKWNIRSRREGVEIGNGEQYETVGKYPFVKVIRPLVPMYERQKRLATLPITEFQYWTKDKAI